MILNDSIITEKDNKRKIRKGDNWKTIRGTHVLVNKNGKIVGGPDNLRSNEESNNHNQSGSNSSNNSEPSEWATKLANAITKGADYIANHVTPFRRK